MLKLCARPKIFGGKKGFASDTKDFEKKNGSKEHNPFSYIAEIKTGYHRKQNKAEQNRLERQRVSK